MLSRQLKSAGVLTLSASLALGGVIAFAAPASAHCVVNVGDCYGHCTVNVGDCNPSAYCTVNVGTCNSWGFCTVNVGYCDTFGFCTVNVGYCGWFGFCVVNVGSCGYRSHAGRSGPCSFSAATDPTVENDATYAGLMEGGPIADETQPGATITLTCTIQVGSANSTHAGANSVSCAGTGTGVAEVACQASYVAPEGHPVYLCAEKTVNGTTYYWDAANGAWSSSSGVICGEAIGQEIQPGPLAPIFDNVAPVQQSVVQAVEPIVPCVIGC